MRFLITFGLSILISLSLWAQTAETKADTVRISRHISERSGIPTVAAVVPRGKTYDVKVQFNGDVTNYKGVMGLLVGAVAETMREAKYPHEWCYITTRERGTERILIKDLKETQALVQAGRVEDAWNYFTKKKSKVTAKG